MTIQDLIDHYDIYQDLPDYDEDRLYYLIKNNRDEFEAAIASGQLPFRAFSEYLLATKLMCRIMFKYLSRDDLYDYVNVLTERVDEDKLYDFFKDIDHPYARELADDLLKKQDKKIDRMPGDEGAVMSKETEPLDVEYIVDSDREPVAPDAEQIDFTEDELMFEMVNIMASTDDLDLYDGALEKLNILASILRKKKSITLKEKDIEERKKALDDELYNNEKDKDEIAQQFNDLKSSMMKSR